MEKKDIIVYVFVFLAVGFSIYRKYIKKNKPGQADQKSGNQQSSIPSVKEDDYEPYSKK